MDVKRIAKDGVFWGGLTFVFFALIGWLDQFGVTGLTTVKPSACWSKRDNALTTGILKKQLEKALYNVVPPKVQKDIFHNDYKNTAPYITIAGNNISNRRLDSANTSWFGSKNWNGRVYCSGQLSYTMEVPISVSQNSGYKISGTVSGNYWYGPTPNGTMTETYGDWISTDDISSYIVNKVQDLQNNNVPMTVLSVKSS